MIVIVFDSKIDWTFCNESWGDTFNTCFTSYHTHPYSDQWLRVFAKMKQVSSLSSFITRGLAILTMKA